MATKVSLSNRIINYKCRRYMVLEEINKENKVYGYIYVVTIRGTELNYVGATTKSVETRIRQHLFDAKNGNEKGLKLCKFHQKLIEIEFNLQKINVKVLKECYTNEELARFEKNYIAAFDSLESGLNMTCGGEISKPVYQFNLEDEEFIMKYDSIHEAGYLNNLKYKSISNACLNTTSSLGGFGWSYDPCRPIHKKKSIKPVEVLNDEGTVVKKFNSATEAGFINGVSKAHITRACRVEVSSAKGLIVRYTLN